MRTETFEGWLEDKFVGFLEIGGTPITKDNCEDMFSGWLENRDVAEMMEYAEEFAQKVRFDTENDIKKDMIGFEGTQEALNKLTILPHTHEEVLQNLAQHGENRNFLESEAIKHGVDFDADTKDEYNRK
jgi:hypothetical protein